jgi:hypothetical protein
MFRDFQIKVQVKRASIKLMFSVLNTTDEFCSVPMGLLESSFSQNEERKKTKY